MNFIYSSLDCLVSELNVFVLFCFLEEKYCYVYLAKLLILQIHNKYLHKLNLFKYKLLKGTIGF